MRSAGVYVADRSNSRIQIFDENGKYLDQWDNIRSPYHIMMTADQHLWVSDGVNNKFLEVRFEREAALFLGHVRHVSRRVLGRPPVCGGFGGNLYAAETFGGRTQKFRPKKGADPANLIGQPGKVPAS